MFALLNMLEKCKQNLSKRQNFMEFFKALNTLHHSPSIYKLNVYGFDKRSLEFTKSNHTNTKLRCKAVHFSIQ